MTVDFALVRLISQPEVDAWTAQPPWVRTAVDLLALPRYRRRPSFDSVSSDKRLRIDDQHKAEASIHTLISALVRDHEGKLPSCEHHAGCANDPICHFA
jgi:hypothetical protein